jgi:EpsI family protein
MIDRRDVLAGVGCAVALGGAELLRPRRRLVLMPEGGKLKTLVPDRFGDWSPGADGDIVLPLTEGSLASRLYNDQLARTYHNLRGGQPDVMVLAAYGAAQSDLLQLHRPEICYPAIGFGITYRRFVDIAAGAGRSVPAVSLTAQKGDRVEDIVYWTRLGDDLPRTSSEQRRDRFMAALHGYVGDGVLFRASATRMDDKPAFDELVGFLENMIASLRPAARLALLGRHLAA